jgi:EpsI family protein
MRDPWRFAPAALLVTGLAVQLSRPAPQRMALRQPLTAVPARAEGFTSRDVAIDSAEVRVAGVDDYLYREYRDSSTGRAFSLYVAYHAAQDQSNQVHSPRNCLPGAGWQVLTTGERPLAGGHVNRYLLELNGTRALVLYWYQGRGQVAAGEFGVKLRMLRDVATTGRSDEAMVRLVLPVATAKGDGFTEADAEAFALRFAGQVIPALREVLP